MQPTEKEMFEAYSSSWSAYHAAIWAENKARGDLENQLKAIAQADWNKQYCTSTADVERRTWLGRFCKCLHLSRFSCAKDRLCNADLNKAAPVVRTSLEAFVKVNRPISSDQRTLAERAITSFNTLLTRYNKAVPERKKLPQGTSIDPALIPPHETGATEEACPDWAQAFYEQTKYLTLAQKTHLIQMVRAGSDQLVIAKFVRRYNKTLDSMKQLSPLHAKLPQEAYLNEEEILHLATRTAPAPQPQPAPTKERATQGEVTQEGVTKEGATKAEKRAKLQIRGATPPPRDNVSELLAQVDKQRREQAEREAQRANELCEQALKNAEQARTRLARRLLNGANKESIADFVKEHNEHLDRLKGIRPNSYINLDKRAHISIDEITEMARTWTAHTNPPSETKKEPVVETKTLSASAPATPRSESEPPSYDSVLKKVQDMLDLVHREQKTLEQRMLGLETSANKLPSPPVPSLPPITLPVPELVSKEPLAAEPPLPAPSAPLPAAEQPFEDSIVIQEDLPIDLTIDPTIDLTIDYAVRANENAVLFSSHKN